jgi:microcin C transport system permease protein
MKLYFLKRLFIIVPNLLIITFLYFALQNVLPGGPVEEALMQIQQGNQGQASQAPLDEAKLQKLRQELEKQYGLDKPMVVRYLAWLGRIIKLDFGSSHTTKKPVITQIQERLPISLAFGLPSFILMYLICIPLGIFLALRNKTSWERGISSFLILLYTIPPLIIGMLLLLVFCTDRILPTGALFPLGGITSPDYSESLPFLTKMKDYVYHLFLPILVSLLSQFTVLTFLQKETLVDVLKSEFIRTARAKGLPFSTVLIKHGLRNALTPVLVGFGGLLGTFLAGSIILEKLFNIPGIGLLALEALQSRDYNVLMAITFFQSLALILGNILNDFIFLWVDPRIRFDR